MADASAIGHSVDFKQLAMYSLELNFIFYGVEGSNAIRERLLEKVPRVRLHEAILNKNVLGLPFVNHELEGGCRRQSC